MSGLEPLYCSSRVISQALQGFATLSKPPISRRLSLLWVAACCAVLRSRWCQSGVNNVLAAPVRATRSADSSENGEYSLIRSSMMPAGAFRGLRRRSHPSSWKVMCAPPRAFLHLHVVPGAARARNRQASDRRVSGSSPGVAEKRSSGPMCCPEAKPAKQIFRTTVHYDKAALARNEQRRCDASATSPYRRFGHVGGRAAHLGGAGYLGPARAGTHARTRLLELQSIVN
jgi:hypothetical protein